MKFDAATQMNDNTGLVTGKSTSEEDLSKLELFYELLLSRPEGITQPEAHRAYYESCLNTMVSNLFISTGIRLARAADHSNKKFKRQRPFTRYWIANEKDRQLIFNQLKHLKMKRISSIKPDSTSNFNKTA